jgi:hypothetical protein
VHGVEGEVCCTRSKAMPVCAAYIARCVQTCAYPPRSCTAARVETSKCARCVLTLEWLLSTP